VLAWLPLRLVHGLADGIGVLLYCFPTRMKTSTLLNLRACFPELPEENIRRLARTSLRHTAKTALEMGKAWLWPMDKTLAMIRSIDGEAVFDAALRNPRGTIVLAPHLGNWEVFGYYVTEKAPTTFLYQPPRDAAMDDLLKIGRSKGRAKLAPTNRQGVADLLKALHRGEMVGILPDQQPPPESGEFAPFFGVPALTMTLVSKLVARTGAGVISGFAQRLPGGEGFKLVMLEADPLVHDPDLDRSLLGLNRSVEACVLKAPEQYQWEYKRFKRRPDGSAFYP
jgi:KDO2-lipid IV(A) lauroyltransferase